jgi:lactobin A/cerein 7B family class IIb bacteriocin
MKTLDQKKMKEVNGGFAFLWALVAAVAAGAASKGDREDPSDLPTIASIDF